MDPDDEQHSALQLQFNALRVRLEHADAHETALIVEEARRLSTELNALLASRLSRPTPEK